MSTRASIKVVDGYRSLRFYKHWDGYPEHTLPLLKLPMKWMKEEKLRKSVGQFSGWLILIGAAEYEKKIPPEEENIDSWKCGAIEPTDSVHGDEEYFYTLNLKEEYIEIKHHDRVIKTVQDDFSLTKEENDSVRIFNSDGSVENFNF